MPFNGSGTFTTVNVFVPNTTILSAAVNQNFSDIATGLSDCLTRDGQAGMTQAFKAISGSVSAPGITFNSDATAGLYLNSTGIVGLVAKSLGILINSSIYQVSAAAVQTGGSGYVVGDTITLTGGTALNQAVLTVATLSGSAVATVTVTYPGNYTVKPSDPVAQGSTSGIGTGATFNMTWTTQYTRSVATDESGVAVWQRLGSSSFVSGLMSKANALDFRTGIGLLSKTAQPPAGSSFKSLVIKTASTTTATVAADFVVVTDGTNYQSLAVSSTINFGTTGVNALDAGTITAATWYAIWVIAKTDGTVACLASTSATSPTMPTGYTYKARVGWIRTVAGGATLNGVYQYGRRAQYVLGVGSTTLLPTISNQTAAIGSVTVPTYVSSSVSTFVPSTAASIYLAVGIVGAGGSAAVTCLIAPNGNYGAYNSTTNMAPVTSVTDTTSNQTLVHGFTASMLLETTNIFVATLNNGGNVTIQTLGWEDNL